MIIYNYREPLNLVFQPSMQYKLNWIKIEIRKWLIYLMLIKLNFFLFEFKEKKNNQLIHSTLLIWIILLLIFRVRVFFYLLKIKEWNEFFIYYLILPLKWRTYRLVRTNFTNYFSGAAYLQKKKNNILHKKEVHTRLWFCNLTNMY